MREHTISDRYRLRDAEIDILFPEREGERGRKTPILVSQLHESLAETEAMGVAMVINTRLGGSKFACASRAPRVESSNRFNRGANRKTCQQESRRARLFFRSNRFIIIIKCEDPNNV